MRKFALCVSLLVIGACTFPDVDYADGGASTSSSSSSSSTTSSSTSSGTMSSGTAPPCPAAQVCTTNAKTCATNAENKDKTCDNKCHGDTGCIAKCDTQRITDLKSCSAVCDTCIKASCGDLPHDCDAIVGL